jgi:hypothetical protein
VTNLPWEAITSALSSPKKDKENDDNNCSNNYPGFNNFTTERKKTDSSII